MLTQELTVHAYSCCILLFSKGFTQVLQAETGARMG